MARILVDAETLETVQKTVEQRSTEAHEAMEHGSPEEIRAAVGRYLEAIRAQRAMIAARYNL